MKYMTFDLKNMIHALHGITWTVRFPSKNNPHRRDAIRVGMMTDKSGVIIPAVPCNEMIGGFIPHLLKWHMQCQNENAVPLIKYIESYYKGDIPEFLAEELKYFSDTEYKAVEYFPYIYQKVFLHQLNEFKVKDTESLKSELAKYNFTGNE